MISFKVKFLELVYFCNVFERFYGNKIKVRRFEDEWYQIKILNGITYYFNGLHKNRSCNHIEYKK